MKWNDIRTQLHKRNSNKKWTWQLGFLIMIILFMILVLFEPYVLGDPDNFTPANPLVTPKRIQPEWYFLFAYAILRSIPNKLGGVIALFISIFILVFMSLLDNSKFLGLSIYPISQIIFWFLLVNLILWTWIGARPVEEPYVLVGILLTVSYFSYYFINPIIKKTTANILDNGW